MGALAAKLESAYRTQQISETIGKTVPMLNKCMKKMDTLGVSMCLPDKLQVGASINDFENIFESLDVKTEELNGALEGISSNQIDQDEVTNLLNEMRDAQGMEVGGGMQNAGKGGIATNAQANDVDEMQRKLDQLKHM